MMSSTVSMMRFSAMARSRHFSIHSVTALVFLPPKRFTTSFTTSARRMLSPVSTAQRAAAMISSGCILVMSRCVRVSEGRKVSTALSVKNTLPKNSCLKDANSSVYCDSVATARFAVLGTLYKSSSLSSKTELSIGDSVSIMSRMRFSIFSSLTKLSTYSAPAFAMGLE